MDLADVERLFRFWQGTPPLRDIVAAFVGASSSRPPSATVRPPELPEFEE